MSETDLLAKIKIQKQENDELAADLQRLINEEQILEEKRVRLEKLNKEKVEELESKKQRIENNVKQSNNKENENDAERREKELDDWLKEKILDLVFDSDEKGSHLENEKKIDKIMVISSVMIRYLPNVEDGDTDAFEKADPYEGYFKINKSTTFLELKETACEFWKIEDPHLIGLRSSNYALLNLHMDKEVEKTMLDLRMAPEFWLFKINKFAKKTFTELKDCFIDSSTAGFFKNLEESKKAQAAPNSFGENQNKKNIEKFKIHYKGLEKYQKQLKSGNLKTDTTKLTGLQYNFNMCLVSWLIFFITVALLVVRRNVSEDYYLQSSINSDIVQGKNSINFFDILTLEDLNKYMLGSFGPGVFPDDQSSNSMTLANRYYVVGPIRIRQVKTQIVPCKKESWGIENVTCYGQDYLTYKYRKDLFLNLSNGTNLTISVFQNSTKAPSSISGDIGVYDSSGYIYDFYSNFSLATFQLKYNNLTSYQWLDRATRAFFVNMNMFLPNSQKFISVNIMVEISVSGVCRPSKLESSVLVSDFYTDSSKDKGMLAIEIVRLLLSFYLVFVYVKSGLEPKYDGTRSPYSWVKLNNIGNLLIFVLIVTCFTFSFFVNTDPKTIITDPEYQDLRQTYYYYSTTILLNAWVLILSFFRIITTFRFSYTLSVNLYAIDLSAKNFIYYLLFLIPILVCLCVFTFHSFGAYMYDYSTPKLVAINNILFTMGQGKIVDYLNVSQAWTIGFLCVYFVIFMFFLFSSFLGLLIDSYRISDMYHAELKKVRSEGEKDWKTWLFYNCSRCRRKKQEEESENPI